MQTSKSIAQVDLSPGPLAGSFTLEKWYVDVLSADGSVLLVYLASIGIMGVRVAQVTADWYRTDGTVVHGDATARDVRGGSGWLRFGPASIDGERLSFSAHGLSGDLIFHPRYPPCNLPTPFLRDGKRTLTWGVEVPDAIVEGWLLLPDGRVELNGRGYRDRVWFDLLPWHFPIGELEWGRAVAGPHAATWVRARTKSGTIQSSWLDGQVIEENGDSPVPPAVTLGPAHIFLDTDVAAIKGLRPAVLRVLLARLCGNPHETKWRAPCEIGGATGMSVYEVARWI